MAAGPLRHVIDFWKPVADLRELESLAFHSRADEPPSRGVNVLCPDGPAREYRVEHAGVRFSLFAAVQPIESVPDSAEVVARILDGSGTDHSYVLHFPEEHAVVLPFDPDAAIEAFWREQYVPPARRTALPKPLLALYYRVKPLLPSRARRILRRATARMADAPDAFLEWPADQSLDLLQRLLLSTVMLALGRRELEFAWFWPDGHPWAVALTHDVETAEGLARAPHIADIERRRGLRSSFNLVPYGYEIPGAALRGLADEGFEIGVHGHTHDGLLFSSWHTFLDRIPAINESARRWGAAGFRSPATYRNPEWYHMLAFEYDSSISNSARYEPQPGGCASFFPFMVGEVVELPITLPQDHTLFMLLGQTDAETWLSVASSVKDANGMACVLCHPDPAPGYVGLAEYEVLYTRLLDAVTGSDAWIPLPRDLARWWRARSLAPCTRPADVAGLSYGTARLDASGRLEIVPPSR